MKTVKRLFTAALTLLFALACALPALAEGETPTYSLTVDKAAEGHTYEIYQILDGVYSQDEKQTGYLADINWGSGVIQKTDPDYAAMKQALIDEELYDAGSVTVEHVNDATKVAMALSKLNNNAQKVDRFNEIVGAHLTQAYDIAQTVNGQAVFTGLPAGYYLVQDKAPVDEGQSYTKYLVCMVGQATIELKSQTMDLDKNILVGGTPVKANNAAMGDSVTYRLTSQTSAMDGYEDYTFVIHDELDRGLTYQKDAVITVGGETYPESDVQITYKTSDQSEYQSTCPDTIPEGAKLDLRIELKNLKQKGKVNSQVVVTYTAKVNQYAVIGALPNVNTAKLEYSNNPNLSQGQSEKTTTTFTTEKSVYTYVAGFEIHKVSPKYNDLPGAQFKIENADTDDAIKELNVIGYSFAKDATGNYIADAAGSYTTVIPDKYTGDYYKANGGTNNQNGPAVIGMTGDGENKTTPGALRFDGLKAGTYTVSEVLAPTGYKKLDKQITVKVTWQGPADSDAEHKCSWDYEITSEENGVVRTTTSGDTVEILNQHGLTLPFTGGAGANLLAGLGLALMAAAAAAFIYIKRRRDHE